jgi:DNA-binding PadR family transcriptional regulator
VISKNRGLNGYQIVKKIKELSNNDITLKIGSIYPQLENLESQGLISKDIENVSESTHMQKAVYTISKKGLLELQNMVYQWFSFSNLINYLIH